METRIPFMGFYESIWSQEIDNIEAMGAERLAEEHDLPEGDIAELLWKNAKYSKAHEEIAEEYVKAFADEFQLKLTYSGMDSPKYYNFETDRLFAKIELSDVVRMYRTVGKKRMRAAAERMFRSRDGFISHYDWDLDGWGSVRGWDHNQLYCLLCEYVEREYEAVDWLLYEALNETIFAAWSNCVDWNTVDIEIGKLIGRKELQEELDYEENGEGTKFPTNWKSTDDYVKQYCAENHLL